MAAPKRGAARARSIAATIAGFCSRATLASFRRLAKVLRRSRASERASCSSTVSFFRRGRLASAILAEGGHGHGMCLRAHLPSNPAKRLILSIFTCPA
jgi:hypothetical protein